MMPTEIINQIRRKLTDDRESRDELDYIARAVNQQDATIRYSATFLFKWIILAFRCGMWASQMIPRDALELNQERVDLTTRLDKMIKIRCHPNAFARAYLLGAKFALEWVTGKARKASEFNPDWTEQNKRRKKGGGNGSETVS